MANLPALPTGYSLFTGLPFDASYQVMIKTPEATVLEVSFEEFSPEALGHSNSERGYPASIGSEQLRAAIRSPRLAKASANDARRAGLASSSAIWRWVAAD